ncbi:MAG: YraN family protein [Patescibacteria group bacterium]
MTNKQDLGQLGENIACRYLVEKRYKIVERNFRKQWGEIDIIAKAPDKTLVFVEVKTIRQYNNDFVNNDNVISAEDQLTKAKLQKLQRTASLYVGYYPNLVDDTKGWQIDLLALTIKENNYVIKHYKNIIL